MLATLILAVATTFAESKTLAVQIALDRRGYSCNTIDGQWGRKSQSALALYCQQSGKALPPTPEDAYDTLFADDPYPFGTDIVGTNELAACVTIPQDPAGKAALTQMGYESILEMYAERGHTSPTALKRLNPQIDWNHVKAGDKILLPDFSSIEGDLATRKPFPAGKVKDYEATLIKISLSKFEVTAYNAAGKILLHLPCSIARDKEKAPKGELGVIQLIPHPNYTYRPDFTPKGQKAAQHIFPEGPNNPVGVAWIGLSLPGYGIHGTPIPERIGRAESHGCFRLANWNAARLYAITRLDTKVIVEP